MWAMRQRSSARILNLGRSQDFVAEVVAEVFSGSQVDSSSTDERRQFRLDLCQTKEPGSPARFELDEKIDVAVAARVPVQT